MALDLDKTLATIKDRQWALADIDWAAPGAEKITDDQRPKLKEFMADLVWIEQVGGRAFAALVTKTGDDTLREIYTYFHAEEQRHANAELALMRRWGMLADDEIPEPNVNIRLIIDWLDRHADATPMSTLGTIIPMLEVALDGALLKFLLEEVEDPLCHQVFARINADESRHLAVDYHVLEMLGAGPLYRQLIRGAGTLLTPRTLIGLLYYTPLLSRMRDNIIEMGLAEERLYDAVRRFGRVGDRSPTTPRNPAYQVLKYHGEMVANRSHPFHRLVGDPLVAVTARVPRRLLRPLPSWMHELTYEPAA